MNASSALRRYEPLARLQLGVEFFTEKEHARELLGHRAAADGLTTCGRQVRDHGADHADGIDAGMAVEAPVLDGENRLLHPRRNSSRSEHAAASRAMPVTRPVNIGGSSTTSSTGRPAASSLAMRAGAGRRRPASRLDDPRLGEDDAHRLAGVIAAARDHAGRHCDRARTHPARSTRDFSV